MPSLLDIGLGKVGSNSHPIHPATVHLPIAFLSLASILDIITYAAPDLLATITNTNTATLVPNLSLLSYMSNSLGILTAFPAISSGLFEAYAMISSKGLDLQNPVVSTTLIHAGLNDIAVLAAAYNWFTKRADEDFAPSGVNCGVSVGILGGVLYAAFLGGSLVYKYGVGVQRMGSGKEEKEKFVSSEKEKAKKEL